MQPFYLLANARLPLILRIHLCSWQQYRKSSSSSHRHPPRHFVIRHPHVSNIQPRGKHYAVRGSQRPQCIQRLGRSQ
jgi:hypothetical protein